MTKTQVEGITAVERRRRWPRGEKERIVAAAMEPGANASAVAREAGLHASQRDRWRQGRWGPDTARGGEGFAAVTIAPERRAAASPAMAPSCGLRSSWRAGRGCGSAARWMPRR